MDNLLPAREFFDQDGYQWVTERTFTANGDVESENTHPVYDADGRPVPVDAEKV